MKYSFVKFVAAVLCVAVLLSMAACAPASHVVESTGSKSALTPDSYEAVYKLIETASATRYGYKGANMEFTDEAMIVEAAESVNSSGMETPAAEDSDAYIGTNVQVDGIDENDIVKTDGRYIFTADSGKVKIIKAEGQETEKLSEIEVCKNSEFEDEDSYMSSGESICGMFISGDVLGVITSKYE